MTGAAPLARQRQEALDPPQIEIAVERIDDEDRVDVRRNDLIVGDRPRRLADESSPAGQHRLDQGRSVAGRQPQRDEIAHGRQVRSHRRLVVEATRYLRAVLRRSGGDLVSSPVLDQDTSGGQTSCGMGLERLLPVLVPSKIS